MSDVFLDTVGLVAVWDEYDQWHSKAEPIFRDLLGDRRNLLSTTFVLLECGNAAARTSFRLTVDRLRKKLENSSRLVTPNESDWLQAWELYKRREGNNAGIVDCVSFVVMRRLGIRQVFSNDEHFRAAGFETLF